MMLVQTPFMKSWEWETMSRMRLNLLRTSSSHTQASRSRWLVGSSKILQKACVGEEELLGLKHMMRASSLSDDLA